MAFNLRLPKNSVPQSEYEEVKIVNKSDLTFENSYGHSEPNEVGDIVLPPKKYTYRKKYAAKHWFGDWDKTGQEWGKEVTRLYTMYGGGTEKEREILATKTFKAIVNHEIYVEGYTDKKEYTSYVAQAKTDTKPTFDISDEPMKMEAKHEIHDLPSEVEDAISETKLKR